jgi:hypothetical protein
VDDGSDPPLEYDGPLPVRIIQTHDTRPWTWALARNRGAKEAKGDWLIMYDLDHVIDRKLLDMVREYDGQKIQFKREFGVITEDGTLKQDIETLVEYGWPRGRYKRKKFTVPAHPNMFAMKKDIFWMLGGYDERWCERPYPQGEDRYFKKRWSVWVREGDGHVHTERPIIYAFPVGKLIGNDVDADPKELFHTLTRKTEKNLYHRRRMAILAEEAKNKADEK